METDVDLALAETLGAEARPSRQVLSLYIPNKDRNGKGIDTEPWIREGATILARMGGGVTITPPYRGGSLKRGGKIQWEDTVIVYSYILKKTFLKGLPDLRKFLHRFGRETGQREVGFEFGGPGESRFYRITHYDKD